MPVVTGKSAKFSLDNAAGSLQDLSGYCQEVNMTFDIQVHDTSVFGVGSRSKIVGIKDGKFSVKFFADPTLMANLVGIFGLATSSSFTYGPEGSTSGMRRYTGECWLTSFPVNANVNDVESVDAQFEITGAVTMDVY